MQLYKDSSGKIYSYNDDVNVAAKTCNAGPLPNIPDGLTPYTPSDADLLAEAQAAQTLEISRACREAITAGFTSSALGSAHTYPCTAQDQANMTASVTASLLPTLPSGWTTPFWCADSSGKWSMVAHTAAQIQQAGSDGKAWIVSNLEKNATLAASILAATTVAAVQAIVWP